MRRKNKRFYGEPMKVKVARKIRCLNEKYELTFWLDALLAAIGICGVVMIALIVGAMFC
jgi:hypothetical protein